MIPITKEEGTTQKINKCIKDTEKLARKVHDLEEVINELDDTLCDQLDEDQKNDLPKQFKLMIEKLSQIETRQAETSRRLEHVETRTENIEELIQTTNHRTDETITSILE